MHTVLCCAGLISNTFWGRHATLFNDCGCGYPVFGQINHKLGVTDSRIVPLGGLMEPIESRSDARSKFIPASPARVFAAMSDPARVAKWWGPVGFTNTIHQYEFVPGGRWLLTMHGPDGKNYPNESRFMRIVPEQVFEIEHLNGHHFVLTLELLPHEEGTKVMWRQTFDTAEHYKALAEFVASANEQNLQRLAAEVADGQGAA